QGGQRSRIVNNLIYNNRKPTVELSKGSIDNLIAFNTLYMTSKRSAIDIRPAGNRIPNTGNRILNNIFVCSEKEPSSVPINYVEGSPPGESDYNIFWAGSGNPIAANETKNEKFSFSGWKTSNFDGHSINADPLFADPDKGDFHLK